MKITYDPTKNARNLAERGLPFELASEFEWDSAVIIEDDRHQYGERRFRAFGYLLARLHVVVFTPRAGAVHVISFRKANQREVKWYGQAHS